MKIKLYTSWIQAQDLDDGAVHLYLVSYSLLVWVDTDYTMSELDLIHAALQFIL